MGEIINMRIYKNDNVNGIFGIIKQWGIWIHAKGVAYQKHY